MKHEIFLHNNQIYSISIGGNKCENTALIDNSSTNDVWFHIAGLPSCHVVMKINTNSAKINVQMRRSLYNGRQRPDHIHSGHSYNTEYKDNFCVIIWIQ